MSKPPSTCKIHPTAIIEPGATLGKNVVVEPFAFIDNHVTLGDNVVIKAYANITGHTTIGEGSTVYPYASIGHRPQALKFKGEKTYIFIGKGCEIREGVTIHSSLGEESQTKIGDHCMIMAYCHIAHNCILGNHVIMGNNAALSGHVELEDYARIGGMTPVHQFVRIGTFAMVGGLSRIARDVPPFTLGGGIPWKFGGLNLIGLKRHGFPLERRRELSKAFRLMYRSGISPQEAIEAIEKQLQPYPEILHWIDFYHRSKRGWMDHEFTTEASMHECTLLEEEEEYLNLQL